MVRRILWSDNEKRVANIFKESPSIFYSGYVRPEYREVMSPKRAKCKQKARIILAMIGKDDY